MGCELHESSVGEAVALFNETHLNTYNHNDPNANCEFVMLRSVHRREPEEKSLLEVASTTNAQAPSSISRAICTSASQGFVNVPVFQRSDLPSGFELTGPAVIEQADTTTLIYDNHFARVDDYGNLLIEVPS